MMAKGDGTNGAKIGRHTRGNSNKMQSQRSAKNKAKAVKRAQEAGDPMDSTGLRHTHQSKYEKRLIEASKRLAHKAAMREARETLRAQDVSGGDWHLGLLPHWQ